MHMLYGNVWFGTARVSCHKNFFRRRRWSNALEINLNLVFCFCLNSAGKSCYTARSCIRVLPRLQKLSYGLERSCNLKHATSCDRLNWADPTCVAVLLRKYRVYLCIWTVMPTLPYWLLKKAVSVRSNNPITWKWTAIDHFVTAAYGSQASWWSGSRRAIRLNNLIH
jgi:hypothetical protein